MSPTFGFFIGSLAVWRVTRLVAYEDGPFRMFARFRERVRTKFDESILDCFNCLSVWVAGIVAPMTGVRGPQLLLMAALSAAAIGVERFIGGQGELREVEE